MRLLGMPLGAAGEHDLDLGPYYLAGASVSLAASLGVIALYARFRQLRHHASSLIFWRAVFDALFTTTLIVLVAWSSARNNCGIFALFSQFALLGSQSWYFIIGIDLWLGLANPFRQQQSYLKQYHLFVWTISLGSALVLVATGGTEWRESMQICWIKSKGSVKQLNVYSWVLFFIPTLVYYVFNLAVTVYSVFRLRRGLEETFKVRTRVLVNGIRYVAAFTAYWTAAGAIYFLIWQAERSRAKAFEDHKALYIAFAVMLGVRGVIDAVVWSVNERVWQYLSPPRSDPAAVLLLDSHGLGNGHGQSHGHGNGQRVAPRGAGAEAQEAEVEDVNKALRKEVLLFFTSGISAAVLAEAEAATLIVPEPYQHPDAESGANSVVATPAGAGTGAGAGAGASGDVESLSTGLLGADALQHPQQQHHHHLHHTHHLQQHPHHPQRTDPKARRRRPLAAETDPQALIFGFLSRVCGLHRSDFPRSLSTNIRDHGVAAREINLKKHDRTGAETMAPFIDFAPRVFRVLRYEAGWSDTAFIQSIQGRSQSMLEKYTEGRSGAFFYFSEDSRLIVKSIRSHEAQALVDMLPALTTHLLTHPESLLARLLGFYCIRMYNLNIFFVVMRNCLHTPPSAPLHQRYDLKGSWINRRARVRRSDTSFSSSFPSFSSATAAEKPDAPLLKDADMQKPLLFTSRARRAFLDAVRSDATFLASQGIMDYSLLLGVHNTRVCVLNRDVAGATSRSHPSQPDHPPQFHQAVHPALSADDSDAPPPSIANSHSAGALSSTTRGEHGAVPSPSPCPSPSLSSMPSQSPSSAALPRDRLAETHWPLTPGDGAGAGAGADSPSAQERASSPSTASVARSRSSLGAANAKDRDGLTEVALPRTTSVPRSVTSLSTSASTTGSAAASASSAAGAPVSPAAGAGSTSPTAAIPIPPASNPRFVSPQALTDSLSFSFPKGTRLLQDWTDAESSALSLALNSSSSASSSSSSAAAAAPLTQPAGAVAPAQESATVTFAPTASPRPSLFPASSLLRRGGSFAGAPGSALPSGMGVGVTLTPRLMIPTPSAAAAAAAAGAGASQLMQPRRSMIPLLPPPPPTFQRALTPVALTPTAAVAATAASAAAATTTAVGTAHDVHDPQDIALASPLDEEAIASPSSGALSRLSATSDAAPSTVLEDSRATAAAVIRPRTRAGVGSIGDYLDIPVAETTPATNATDVSPSGEAGASLNPESSWLDAGVEAHDAASSPAGYADESTFATDPTQFAMPNAAEGGILVPIVEGPGAYFFGIVDFLTRYDTSKKAERFVKVWLRCQDPAGISAIAPEAYRDRFLAAMERIAQPADGVNAFGEIVVASASAPAHGFHETAGGVASAMTLPHANFAHSGEMDLDHGALHAASMHVSAGSVGSAGGGFVGSLPSIASLADLPSTSTGTSAGAVGSLRPRLGRMISGVTDDGAVTISAALSMRNHSPLLATTVNSHLGLGLLGGASATGMATSPGIQPSSPNGVSGYLGTSYADVNVAALHSGAHTLPRLGSSMGRGVGGLGTGSGAGAGAGTGAGTGTGTGTGAASIGNARGSGAVHWNSVAGRLSRTGSHAYPGYSGSAAPPLPAQVQRLRHAREGGAPADGGEGDRGMGEGVGDGEGEGEEKEATGLMRVASSDGIEWYSNDPVYDELDRHAMHHSTTLQHSRSHNLGPASPPFVSPSSSSSSASAAAAAAVHGVSGSSFFPGSSLAGATPLAHTYFGATPPSTLAPTPSLASTGAAAAVAMKGPADDSSTGSHVSVVGSLPAGTPPPAGNALEVPMGEVGGFSDPHKRTRGRDKAGKKGAR